MKNNKYHFNSYDIRLCLKKLRLKKGDSIFLSTNIGILGFPQTNNKNKILISSKLIFKTLKEVLGKDGNIFVPTYSYTFAKKVKTYNPDKTKADIGYFPNFFLKQKNVVRSADPMVSIAGIGPGVNNILLNVSNNSFGRDCVLERLLKVRNLKCLNIGLGYNWIPFIHYLDWVNNVPFRFNKILKGNIKIKNKQKKVSWVYYARYLRKETISNGYKIGYKALKNNLYLFSELGKSMVYAIDYKKLYKFAEKMTKKNKWLTVNGPKFYVK